MIARHPWFRLLLATALSFSVLFSSISYVPQAHAEGPSDPAPEILHVGTANGKKVLFDNTHGQTAGAADWVIDGAFSDFGNALANEGYDVKELRKSTPIVLSDLSDYDVFVVGEANIPYKATEQAAMLQYVQNGGSIFFIADHYNADRNKNRWDSSEAFNGYRRGAWSNPAQGMNAEESSSAAMSGVVSSDWLGSNFGVRFRYNALGNVTANQIAAPAQAFNITAGVSTVAMHAGSTLAIIDPNKAKGIVYLPATTAKWSNAVDQGVYAGGGIAEGPYAAISKVGAGKAAFIGDSSPVEDATPKYKREETGGTKTTYAGFQEQDDATLLVNVVNWLALQESYTSLNQVSGLTLDQPTPLLAIENPQTSTEPQSEPWSAPAAGYKWYDPSTFKAGSYGYGTGGGDPGEPGGGGTGVFFSEYIEGSSNNKAVEIYNGTGVSVNLTGYSISSSNVGTAINLSGTLASGDVYVVANPSAAAGILSQADLLSNNLSFNGDDSVTLSKNGTSLDVIGTAGISFGTDKTLVRKSTVTAGTTIYADAQWDALANNTITNLGSHTITSSNQPPVVANPIANRSIAVGSGASIIDATNTFSDPDGNALTLSAVSSNASVATVSVASKQLTINPLAAGTAALTVTAADGNGGSVSTTFTVTVTAASTVILNEAFESGSKGSYTAGNVALSSGSWNMDNALIGNLSTDKKNGLQAARIKSAGSISMNFDAAGAKTVKVSHASFGTDTGAVWKLQKSVNSGTSWTDVTGTFSPSSTLAVQTITVNENASVRFRILVSGTSGSRINIDDIQIFN
ncbi:lamin tail domain-containing protein [Paenibacillus sp. PL91]|uniref:lamin tail domain-containing protein n=1 Tax=Paenibacillus sp. PL91 TaxID=2729538 RepID=UPI00145E898E|nr:lamin tail domain-containing protein [Paenibacillus sp. PL91]MBC9201626.1 lamin tail domain-containing protein [Paenibacillus sp. PL91]